MSRLIEVPFFEETDGCLGSFEPKMIPGFEITRVFYICNVPKGIERANHACMNASVVFIIISGSVTLSVEDEGHIDEYRLESNKWALYVKPATWIRAYDFSSDAVLMCFSDKSYDQCDYVSNYLEYKRRVEK